MLLPMAIQVRSVQWTSLRTNHRSLTTTGGRIVLHQYDLLPAEVDSFCAALREAAQIAQTEAGLADPAAASALAGPPAQPPPPAFQKRHILRWYITGAREPALELAAGSVTLPSASVPAQQLPELAEAVADAARLTGRAAGN